MSLHDVTTEQLFAELASRYEHLAMVGVAKKHSDQGLFLSGKKTIIDNLMAEFIAGRFSIGFARTEGRAANIPIERLTTGQASVEQQIQALVVALGKSFGEMIVCGIPQDDPATDKFNVMVQPFPPQANEQQLANLRRIVERINSLPLPESPEE